MEEDDFEETFCGLILSGEKKDRDKYKNWYREIDALKKAHTDLVDNGQLKSIGMCKDCDELSMGREYIMIDANKSDSRILNSILFEMKNSQYGKDFNEVDKEDNSEEYSVRGALANE